MSSDSKIELKVTSHCLSSLHLLPLSDAWLLAAIDMSMSICAKHFILSRCSDVSQSSRNWSPTSTPVNWSHKDAIITSHPIDIGMTSINLLQTATDLDPTTRAWLFTLVDTVITAHSSYVAISTGRYMF